MKAGTLQSQSAMKVGMVAPSKLSFSFRYMDRQHNKFSYSEREAGYFCKVLERLSVLCDKTVLEVQAERSSALRAHPIEWDHTSEPTGFSHLNEQLRESRPYQFSISSNAHGRVHGFFIDHVFYVVWLDPDHRLYPGR